MKRLAGVRPWQIHILEASPRNMRQSKHGWPCTACAGRNHAGKHLYLRLYGHIHTIDRERERELELCRPGLRRLLKLHAALEGASAYTGVANESRGFLSRVISGWFGETPEEALGVFGGLKGGKYFGELSGDHSRVGYEFIG